MGIFMRNREEARKKAKELVAQMTLEEKASQLKYDAPPIKRLGVPARSEERRVGKEC